MITLSRKVLAAAALLSASAVSQAGIMDDNIPVQTYRDFAENRGIFAPGATNVVVTYADGTTAGTVARVMNFDSVVDGGWSALTGGASFLATVSHNNATDISFGTRFGATSGTPFYDSYHVINYNRGWGAAVDYTYDYAVPRLNKIVTEAAAVPYLTDTSILNNMVGRDVVRVGGGTQTIATGNGAEYTVSGAYSYLTGGTIRFDSETVRIPAPGTVPANANGTTYQSQTVGSAPASAYNSYSFIYYNQNPTSTTPLDIGIRAGDSGSASWTYNTNTARWEYVGAAQSGGGAGDGALNQMRSGNAYAAATILAYNSPTITPTSGGGNITWNTPDSSGNGTFTQGATSWSYVGLASTVRGATSTLAADGTSTTAANDATMDATRNLVLAGSGGTIVLGGSIDMGAGSLTFNANYTLTDGGVSTRRLNSAGFIIAGGVTVTDSLTGIAGDEWRVISDSSTSGIGTFAVTGSGANAADLNLGGNLLVTLNRTGGAAARDVTINGGGVTVRLVGANQISGDVIFGHRGGTLDLYGNNMSDAAITHLDNGAAIENTKANADSTFTFTGSGAKSYLGAFIDGGSLANGRLNLVYNPGTPSGAVWNLSGFTNTAGTVTVSGGELRVAGTPTLHAGGYVDPNDWQTAVFNTGTVSVASGATFTAADHATVGSAVSVAGGGTFQLLTGGNHTGGVALNASNAAYTAGIASGSATESGAITGTGALTKTGAGTLNLTNTGNTFSGAKTLSAGTILGASLGSLGDTTTNLWSVATPAVIAATGATAAQVKAKLTTGSTGTLALAGTNPDAAPDMTGYAGLFLGAIGAQTVGTSGTSNTLTAWTSGSGWNLGGGGGTLTMNNKLTGSGALVVGNGYNTGTVVLTNANTFTGGITVNSGVILRATDAAALGSGTNDLTVSYGAIVAPAAAAATGTFARIATASSGVFAISGSDSNAYNFAGEGLNSLALGADGTATYSGTLTAGTSGYKFGGNGALTVASTLSGTNALSADGQGTIGGVTTLTGTNTFTGGITVLGGVVNGITGSHALRAGSAGAFGSGNTVALQNGGLLDVNGYNASLGALTGVAGSALVNASATASTVTIAQGTDGTMAGTIAGIGALNLVKTGAGILTLSGTNTQTGTVTVNAGVLRLGVNDALGATTNTVTVASGGSLDFAGKSASSNPITVSGAGNGTLGALHNSWSSTTASLGTVTLAANATMSGTGTSAAFTPDTINLAGNTLTVTNARLNTGDSQLTNGNITGGSNSLFFIGGTQTGAGSTGTWTLGTGSELAVRDYNNIAMTNEKTLVLDGGKISNGNIDNGGGAQSTIANAITVNSGGGTIQANNTGFGLDLKFAGALSGTGTLALTGGRATEFQGSTSGFTGNITNATRLVMSGAGAQSLTGVISGGGALVKSGAGTLTLSGNNTYTGSTTINAGVLDLSAGNLYGSAYNNTAVVTVNTGGTLRMDTFNYGGSLGQLADFSARRVINGGTLEVNGATHSSGNDFTVGANGGTFRYNPASSSNTLTLAGNANDNIAISGALTFQTDGNITVNEIIGGSGSLTKTGAQTLTLGAANTYTGGTAVNAGTLVASASNNLGTGAIAIGSAGTLALTAATNQTITAAITGSGTLVKSGTANLVLQGANTFSGQTTVTAGYLVLDSINAENGAGALALNGGSLALGTAFVGNTATIGSLSGDNAASSINNAYGATTGTRTLGVNQTVDGTYAGSMSDGSGGRVLALTKSGAATLTLTGTNTYTGGTTVTAGTLRADSASALAGYAAAGKVAVNSGATLAVNVGGSGQWSSANLDTLLTNATLASGSTLGVDTTGGDFTHASVVSGNIGLTKLGANTLTLAGANTYTGGTTVNGGTLVAGNASALGTGAVTVNAATLDLNAGSVSTGAVTITGGTIQNGTITGASYATASATVSAALAGSGALTQSGGVTTLSGANTYSGGTTVNSGTLVAANASALGSGAVVVNSATLDLGAGSVTTGAVTLAGGTIQNGTLTGTSYATQSGTASAALAGSGALTQTGSGTTVLSGNNTYTGTTTISGGTLQVGSGGTSGTLGSGAVVNNGTLAFNRSNAATVANAVSGTGSVVKNGAGVTTLTGSNTYSGTTTVNAGTLQATTTGALSGYDTSGKVAVNSGGTLAVNVGGAGQWTSANVDTLRTNATFASGSALGIDTTGGAFTYASAVSGNLGLTKLGSNTLTLTLTGANTYTGATNVAAGTLQVGSGGSTGALGSGAVTVNGTLTFNKTGSTTVANAISGSGNIVNTAGTTILTGTSTFTGTTTLNGGAFVLNSASADSANNAYVVNTGGWLTLADPFVGGTATIGSLSGTGGIIDTAYAATTGTRTLGVNQTVDGTYAGVMQNAGSRLLGLAKTGSAALTLSGNNTYSGATTVTAGTLVAGHNSAFGTSAVTVSGSGILNSGVSRTLANAFTINSGGTLAGSATFTGTVVVNSGATLSPGASGAPGAMSFSNGVTLASGATYLWHITGSAPSVAGTDFDRIAVTAGTMNINSGATLKLAAAGIDYTGVFWDSSQTFTLATKSGTGTITGSFGTLDTSLAGAYSAEGSWSLITGGSGELQALWTASSDLMGLQPVPEPSTYGLMGAGALAVAAMVRRRRKTAGKSA